MPRRKKDETTLKKADEQEAIFLPASISLRAIAAEIAEKIEKANKRIGEARKEIENGARPRKDRFRL